LSFYFRNRKEGKALLEITEKNHGGTIKPREADFKKSQASTGERGREEFVWWSVGALTKKMKIVRGDGKVGKRGTANGQAERTRPIFEARMRRPQGRTVSLGTEKGGGDGGISQGTGGGNRTHWEKCFCVGAGGVGG